MLDSEYPLVDGKLSVKCYLSSLDKCYSLYKQKYSKKLNNNNIINKNNKNGICINGSSSSSRLNGGGIDTSTSTTTAPAGSLDDFDITKADAFVFHTPYCKLVQKSFARLLWNDYCDNSPSVSDEIRGHLDKFK